LVRDTFCIFGCFLVNTRSAVVNQFPMSWILL
jgi:hypothetical protein